MIDKIIGLVKAAQDWWWGLLEPVTSPTTLVIYLVAFSAVALFFILRDQYKRCEAMFILEGIELIAAGFIGGCALAAFYGLPFIFLATIAAFFLMGVLTVLQFLVVVSVKGVKR